MKRKQQTPWSAADAIGAERGQTLLSFRKSGSESVALVGYIEADDLHPALRNVSRETGIGSVLVNSPVSHRNFEEEDRDGLSAFVGVVPWTDAVAHIGKHGGTESDLTDWVKARLLVRLPGQQRVTDFPRVFADLSLISLTGHAQRPGWETGDLAWLTAPGAPDTQALPVTREFYSMLERSSGSMSLPECLLRTAGGDPEVLFRLVRETLETLPTLLEHRIAALLWAR